MRKSRKREVTWSNRPAAGVPGAAADRVELTREASGLPPEASPEDLAAKARKAAEGSPAEGQDPKKPDDRDSTPFTGLEPLRMSEKEKAAERAARKKAMWKHYAAGNSATWAWGKWQTR